MDEHERALLDIEEDLTRLTALADQLLQLGSAEPGPPDSRRGDLAAAATKAVAARIALAAPGTAYAAPGALSVAAAPPVLVALKDTTLTRVVDNLLDNAALHGRAPVVVTVDAVGEVGRLRVADSGDGMESELLHRATERFARAEDARSRPGSGLGLSLVATAVTAAGGQVRLCYQGSHAKVGPDPGRDTMRARAGDDRHGTPAPGGPDG